MNTYLFHYDNFVFPEARLLTSKIIKVGERISKYKISNKKILDNMGRCISSENVAHIHEGYIAARLEMGLCYKLK